MNIVRKFLGWVACWVFLISCLWLYIENKRNGRLDAAYTREAVNSLALNASLSVPAERSRMGDRLFWSRKQTACIFITNSVQRTGNGGSLTWANWPAGEFPTCDDFFSSATTEDIDWESTVPSNCYPVVNIPIRRKTGHYFAVAASDMASFGSLRNAALTEDQLKILAIGERKYASYPQVSPFLRGGGMSGVKITLMEASQCEAFELFLYEAEVKNTRELQRRLEVENYFVGMK